MGDIDKLKRPNWKENLTIDEINKITAELDELIAIIAPIFAKEVQLEYDKLKKEKATSCVQDDIEDWKQKNI